MDEDYLQPAQGYRFSEDSVLLARFLPLKASGRAADLGAGCGVVGLEALASGRLKGLEELFLIERDEAFKECLEYNARKAHRAQSDKSAKNPPTAENAPKSENARNEKSFRNVENSESGRSWPGAIGDRNGQILSPERLAGPEIKVIWADWRDLAPGDLTPGFLSLAFANPPYVKAGSGRRCSSVRDSAKREGPGGLPGLLDAAWRLLEPGGRLIMSWPRPRLRELAKEAGERGMAMARIAAPARARAPLALLELISRGGLECSATAFCEN